MRRVLQVFVFFYCPWCSAYIGHNLSYKTGQQIYWRKAIQQIIHSNGIRRRHLYDNQPTEQLKRIKAQSKGTVGHEKWTTFKACFVLQKSMGGRCGHREGVYPEIAQLFITLLRMITIYLWDELRSHGQWSRSWLCRWRCVFGNPRREGNWQFQVKEMMRAALALKKIASQLPYVADNVYVAVVKRSNKDDKTVSLVVCIMHRNTSTDTSTKTEEFDLR